MRQYYPHFFYPENQGLESLSDLQVRCGVGCKPRSSNPKSSGFSVNVQLPLENQSRQWKKRIPKFQDPVQPSLISHILSEACLSRVGLPSCLGNGLESTGCKFKEMDYKLKEPTWRTGKAALCLKLWGCEGWHLDSKACEGPYHPQIFHSSFFLNETNRHIFCCHVIHQLICLGLPSSTPALNMKY